MKVKALFSEYHTLSYYPGQKPKQTKDIGVKPYMILRTSPAGWNVLNLWNGTSILIPWRMIDLFLGLNVWGGARMLREEAEDGAEKFILRFLVLVQSVERRDMKNFLMALGEILKLGTKEFREWILKETGEKFGPLEINSLDRYRELWNSTTYIQTDHISRRGMDVLESAGSWSISRSKVLSARKLESLV